MMSDNDSVIVKDSPGTSVDESWIHLGGEPQAKEDIGQWYRSIQSRLKDIPSSSTDYQTLLNTIQQLQDIFDAVHTKKSDPAVNQLKLSFSFDDLYRSLSIKQDTSFKEIISIHKEKLEDIQQTLEDVEQTLGQKVDKDWSYPDTQTLLDSVKDVRKTIASCDAGLQTILDAPRPTRQASFVQKQVQQIEQDSISPKSQAYRESESICNSATTQLLFCQDLERRLENKIEELDMFQKEKRENYLKELSDVEHWLTGFYSLLCQEPVRDVEGGGYASGQQVIFDDQDPNFGYDSSEDLLLSDSGSSVGAEHDHVALETSVDADLGDDEYMEQITQRVFSPVDGPQLQGETDLDEMVAIGPPFEQETDLDEKLTSPKQFIHVQQHIQQRSTDLDAVTGIGVEGSDVDSDTVVGAESTGSGSTVQAIGVRKDQVREPQGLPESVSVGDDVSEEEGSSSREEGSGSYENESDSSGWSESVELLSMIHDATLDQHLPHEITTLTPENITILLQALMTAQDELPMQEAGIRDALSKVALILSSSGQEEELLRRVGWVETVWDLAAESLTARLSQLQFENQQRTVRASILEVKQELEAQPNLLLTAEEVSVSMNALLDYFENGIFEKKKNEQLAEMQDLLTKLVEVWPKGATSRVCGQVVERLTQAYETIKERVTQQKAFLVECLSLWTTFQSGCGQLSDWLDHVEELVAKETYGYDIKETEECYQTITALKKQLPSYESQFTELFEHGDIMMQKMVEGGEAAQSIDQKLSSFEQRFSDLVTQNTGAIDTLESAVKKVLIDWKAFTGMYGGTQSFISQMTKMVGTEPLESSNGDNTILTTYMTYQEQLTNMEVQYNRLVATGESLLSNKKIGNRDGIRSDLSRLQVLWHPLRDNVSDSFKLLVSEYNDWIMMKLQKMSGMVRQAEELVSQKVIFVEGFPLAKLFDNNAAELLKEADILVASQEELDQLENDCTDIEEDLLQRQVQQETSPGMRKSASSLELPATILEKQRLQENRLKLQTTSDALQPIINVFYLQLQLLQSMQDGRSIVSKAMELVGGQEELEEVLADLELKLSGDFFEGLSAEAYDLGAVAEDCEHTMDDIGEQEEFTLPPYQEISRVNRLLADEVETLSSNTERARMRLTLFIQWWAEYYDNYDDLSRWLEGAETRLQQLVARAESTQPPLVSPAELLIDVQELQSECKEKQVLLNALTSTSRNIIDEITTRGSPPGEITDQATDIQQRFKTLCEGVEMRVGVLTEGASLFDSFINLLTDFANWLNEFHSTLYDEVCVRIQAKASDEIISRHKNRLEGYLQKVSAHTLEYESLMANSDKWGDHLIPDESGGNLPSPSEPSPPPFSVDDDFASQVPLPYVKKRLGSISKKWSKIQELIVEREHQLEINGGSIQTFFESLQAMTDWIEGKLKLEILASPPPANLTALKEHLQLLKDLETEMEGQVVMIESLTQAVAALKQTLSGPNVVVVERKMSEMNQLWTRLEEDKDKREKVCQALMPRIKSFWVSCDGLEEWVAQRETTFTECGPIGANLTRLKEQGEILQTLDDELLEKKREPEDVVSESTNLLKECQDNSGADILTKSKDMDARFSTLSQESVERLELCEEALSACQDFQKKVDSFVQWLEIIEKSLTDMKDVKKPIGTIQLQLDEFYDFMRDVETHTEDYLSLCPEAKRLSDQYKPSDVLDEMMVGLGNRWTQCVEALTKRCDDLLELIALWNKYESEVKGLLDWITDEANKFSKQVTTKGDEGVEDYIQACKEFTDTMSNKKEGITEIQKLADKLRKEDGVKKNGTSDVDSRWNDVNQHWGSLVKLLSETMLHLESTHAEMRHVIRIRREEFGWLETCELAAADKVRTEGDVAVIEQEIETHKQLLTEIQNHQKECEFIKRTITFLVEHSRKENREPLKAEAEDFCARYQLLLSSEDTYISHLQESIPYWEEFKKQSHELSEWIDWANEELVSDRVVSGNASVTNTSLDNAQNLLQDTRSKKAPLNAAVHVGDDLNELVVSADQQYIADTLECLKDGQESVNVKTENLVTMLDDRLRSWQVFPVEEARVVQEFLEDVSNAIEEDLDEEELSSEQLMDKIEQLESLQEAQQSNEQKVFAIEQSAGSDAIKKALEKNPDISKERNNLLQGWSCVSSTLRDKITTIKQKASMVKEVESLCRSCEDQIKDYQSHLDAPLLPSVLLESIHADTRERADRLHNSCQSLLTSLNKALHKYDSSNNQFLTVPVYLRDKASSCSDQFTRLSARAEEWGSRIDDIISSWTTFKEYLGTLLSWCNESLSEVSTLSTVQNFATDFSSLEFRLQTLSEDIQDRADKFDYLVENSSRHCTGDNPMVKKVGEEYTSLAKSWRAITDRVKSLTDIIKPWKELTDLYEKLCNSYERLKGMVERALTIVEERDGGNLSDIIHQLMENHSILVGLAPQFQKLHQLDDKLLTDKICSKSKPAKKLKKVCQQVENDVEELQQRVQRKLTDLKEQEKQWKVLATNSIERLPVLEQQLAHSERSAREEREVLFAQKEEAENENCRKEERIRQLEKYQHLIVSPKSTWHMYLRCFSWKWLLLVLFLVLLLAIGFVLLGYNREGKPKVFVM